MVSICVPACLSIYLSIHPSIHPNPSIYRVLIRSSYSEIETSTAPTVLTQQTTNTWRNLAHPSDASPSRCRRSVFFPSSNGQESSTGLAMKHKCSSASSCSQKRHTRWHVSGPLRSEALRAVTTSKRGRRPPVFNTFDFRMCFAPQRRTLFRHLDFHKWSGPGVFCAFWLGNVLRAWVWRTLVRHLNFQKWSETASFLHFWLGNVVVVVVIVVVVAVVVVVIFCARH